MEGILGLIGASENTIGFARKYLLIISIGAPTILFSTAFANILRGEGAARESMVGNLLGTIINIVLDPVMILMLGWGVTGAALATIIGNIAACLFYLQYFLRKNPLCLSAGNILKWRRNCKERSSDWNSCIFKQYFNEFCKYYP